MFDTGAAPAVDLGCNPMQFRDLDHNLDGLDKVTSARDEHVGTDTHAFLDEIPVGKSLLEKFAEAAKGVGGNDGMGRGESEELFRRLTFEGRRGEISIGAVIIEPSRRSFSDGEVTPVREMEERMKLHYTSRPPMSTKLRKSSKCILRDKSPAISRYDGPSSSADVHPQNKRSSSAPETRSATQNRKQKHSRHQPGTSGGDSSIDTGFPERNMNKLLLYNWFLLRMDNIKILSSVSDNLKGKGDDFGLLKLLAGTHEERRWWTILVDDLACPQCVEVLRPRRTDAKLSKDVKNVIGNYPSPCTRFFTKFSRTIHSDGWQCRIECNHLAPKSNHVTRFFAKLGHDTAFRMKNILLETQPNEVPDPDKLVSAVQNVKYYFPDVQNLEIAFHFGDQPVDHDTRTRILCSLVQLEGLLPKGRHLRILGIGGCLELMNGWTRRGRRWHE